MIKSNAFIQTDRVDQTGSGLVETPYIRFEIDKQTWKDLDLFEQGRRGLVFALFNKTKTEGGGDALERMLKSPSTQRSVLETRRDTIQFFSNNNIDLRIGRHLEEVEHYLSSNLSLFPRDWWGAFGQALRNQINERPDYYTIATGVRNTVSLLRYLFKLTAGWPVEDCPAPLVEVVKELPQLIGDRRVRTLLLETSGHLRWWDIARSDHFFRGAGKPAVRRLLELVYEWDAYQAAAAAVQQYNLCYPQYRPQAGSSVEAQGLFHPLVDNAVPNDYTIDERTNLCFISGANMAGKSTFLKSFGLAVYLAHVGFPVPARSFTTSIFHGLITTINLADSISQGYSHFYAEVRRVKEVVEKLLEKQHIVVIFDELFRGTNVKDASDASLQVIDSLAGVKGSLFLVSTHIVELAAELRDNPNIFFTCFPATMEGGVPWYGYKLKNGVCDERAGMMILRTEGILDLLREIRRAQGDHSTGEIR